jgi:hypothetical protein
MPAGNGHKSGLVAERMHRESSCGWHVSGPANRGVARSQTIRQSRQTTQFMNCRHPVVTSMTIDQQGLPPGCASRVVIVVRGVADQEYSLARNTQRALDRAKETQVRFAIANFSDHHDRRKVSGWFQRCITQSSPIRRPASSEKTKSIRLRMKHRPTYCSAIVTRSLAGLPRTPSHSSNTM